MNVPSINSSNASANVCQLSLVHLKQRLKSNAPVVGLFAFNGTSATCHHVPHQLHKRLAEVLLLVVVTSLGKVSLFTATSRTETRRRLTKQQSVRNAGGCNHINAKLLQDLCNTSKLTANKRKFFFLRINRVAAIDALAHVV